MRLPATGLSSVKNIIHAVQAFLIFLCWVLTIAVFTRPGSSDGRTAWFFALTWLSIPALIYLVMVPMWSRAQRFAHAYAYLALDGLFALFWFTGWIAVASYVISGKGKGKSKDKKATGCDNFKYGSAGKCELSEATIILGVIIFLLFCGTTYLSAHTAMAFRRTGTMPAPTRGQSNDTSFAAQTKAAFSSNPRQTDSFDADFDAEDELHAPPRAATGPASRRTREDDEYALLHQSEERLDDVGLVHPGRPVSYGQPEREDGSPARPPGLGGYNSGSYHGEAGSGVDTSYGGPYGAHNNRSGSVGGSGDPFRSDLELSHGAGDYDLAGGRPYGGVAPPPMYER